jgi:hypothetical protein
MGSYSRSDSTAIDNRLAVTDEAFGLSSSGTGNNVALSGHILNIGSTAAGNNSSGTRSLANSSTSTKSTGGGGDISGLGGGLNINLLDGGAIDKSFNFAAFSLSEMLGSIIEGGRHQQQTAMYTVDTIGSAIQQASTISAAAAEASAAVDQEINGNYQALIKKGLIVLGVGVAAWWLLKGKK